MPVLEIYMPTKTAVIERAFKDLINTKHQYQSIEIDFEPMIRKSARDTHARNLQLSAVGGSGRRAQRSEDEIRRELLTELDETEWVFASDKYERSQIPFSLPPAKTLCSVCDDVTSFNLWSDGSARALTLSLGRPGRQVFYLPLQCQGCRSNIIVFMVARNGRKIQLVGRSEFEEVKVPEFIPKKQKRFYSQAVIAFNCGQILAALFLLRTLIEQHMHTVTKSAELRGEDLCEQYNKTLDADFKDRFASFKEIYGELSDALHRAEPNGSLFESQIEQIRLHFKGLDLFSKVKKKKR